MLDYANIRDLFSDEERQIQSQARRFLEAEALPLISQAWDQAVLPQHLGPKFAAMGFFGPSLPKEYGCAGVSSVAYGLMMYELERIDSGLRSFASVQGALVMYPIYKYGSEFQRQKYLTAMAKGQILGCFGLTESDGGSDPGAMKTRAKATKDGVLLSGSKMWITNGNIANVALIWAKDDDGIVRGYLVDLPSKGFVANEVKRKQSLRASVTSELVLDEVFVPAEQCLPNAQGLAAPLSCLTQARYGISWGALGALEAVYSEALNYAKTRSTFGKPIAARQLVQDKLVRMLSDHTRGLLLAWRLGRLKDEGKLSYAQVSLAKRDNVRAALQAARAAREILGGNGITTEYHTIRHMLNLETVDTYEGTHDIHTLILGRDITGLNALE